jgi:hypothetical protein
MTTSQNSPLLAKALDPELRGKRIPKQQLEYFRTRLMFRMYSLIQDTFHRLSKERKEFSQAYLAKRLGRGPELISRWMNNPSNLELKTVSDLLLAMGQELSPDVRGLDLGARPPTEELWLRPSNVQNPILDKPPADVQAPMRKELANDPGGAQARLPSNQLYDVTVQFRKRPVFGDDNRLAPPPGLGVPRNSFSENRAP